jgi:hypothetical protein
MSYVNSSLNSIKPMKIPRIPVDTNRLAGILYSCRVSEVLARRRNEPPGDAGKGDDEMSYHKSNLGSFGGNVPADIDGYVPDAKTGAWELHYDHGVEQTHNEDGSLTEYGEWWESEGFPDVQAAAIAATADAEDSIRQHAHARP